MVLGISLLLVWLASPAVVLAQDTFTTNSTSTANSNQAEMRGFDPLAISNPNDPFPNTETPCCFLETSTQFGNGVPTGSSTSIIDQQRNTSLSGAGLPMSNRDSLLSGPGVIPGQRVHHIESSFDQEVIEQGQIFNLSFSIDSTTDSDGNLLGQATGSFSQVVSDPVSTQGLLRVCSGTFTFDETNGFILTSGPEQQCG